MLKSLLAAALMVSALSFSVAPASAHGWRHHHRWHHHHCWRCEHHHRWHHRRW